MKLKALLLVCTFSISSSLALADTFTFTANGPGITGSGTIFATPSSTPGVDDVTGISGQLNGFFITGRVPGVLQLGEPQLPGLLLLRRNYVRRLLRQSSLHLRATLRQRRSRDHPQQRRRRQHLQQFRHRLLRGQ